MKARLVRTWERFSSLILAVTVTAAALGISWGLWAQHEENARGSTDHQILTTLSHEVKILEAGGKRHSAEIAALDRSNVVLSEIFDAAAIEEENLLNIDQAVCAAEPHCVAPALIPVPPITSTSG